jgi:hypothetical protein
MNVTLKEGHRLGVFESRALRGIFGSELVELTGGWGNLCDEKVHDTQSSVNIIRVIKWGRI